MSQPKPAAALSSGLLARRGAARPAMRRPTVGGLTASVSALEDLGWNDINGTDAETAPPVASPEPAASAAAPPSPVARSIAALSAGLAAARPTPPASALPDPAGRKTAFTLRLDAERHLRLRLLSAVSNRSAQQLLISALDALIAANPHVEALAADDNARTGIRSPDMD